MTGEPDNIDDVYNIEVNIDEPFYKGEQTDEKVFSNSDCADISLWMW